MEPTKCQRMFLLLALWVAAIIIVLYSSSQTLLTISQSKKFKNTVPIRDSSVNSLSSNSIHNKTPPKNEDRGPQAPIHVAFHPIAVQQNTKFSSFRQKFLLWDKANETIPSTIGLDYVGTLEKYLIYRCDTQNMRLCGGWADRVKGVLLTYVIANLTGRTFKVEILKPPCHLLNYLTPNLINWSLPFSSHIKLGKTVSRAISKVDNVNFLVNIHQTNFTEMLEERDSKVTYFNANLDYSNGLQKNKMYSKPLSWMANLSNDKILSTLYKRVFKLSGELQQRMNDFMQETLPTSRHRLICAHVRMGANPTIPNDTVERFHESHLATVWKFLSLHSRTDQDKIFLISDSESVVHLAKSQPFGHRLVESEGPINHIDRSSSVNVAERCAGLGKVIFDQHILMQCDVLMISLSGISRMAAYIRGSSEGLFCLLRKGKIVPCKPENIRKLYRIMV